MGRRNIMSITIFVIAGVYKICHIYIYMAQCQNSIRRVGPPILMACEGIDFIVSRIDLHVVHTHVRLDGYRFSFPPIVLQCFALILQIWRN